MVIKLHKSYTNSRIDLLYLYEEPSQSKPAFSIWISYDVCSTQKKMMGSMYLHAYACIYLNEEQVSSRPDIWKTFTEVNAIYTKRTIKGFDMLFYVGTPNVVSYSPNKICTSQDKTNRMKQEKNTLK